MKFSAYCFWKDGVLYYIILLCYFVLVTSASTFLVSFTRSIKHFLVDLTKLHIMHVCLKVRCALSFYKQRKPKHANKSLTIFKRPLIVACYLYIKSISTWNNYKNCIRKLNCNLNSGSFFIRRINIHPKGLDPNFCFLCCALRLTDNAEIR